VSPPTPAVEPSEPLVLLPGSNCSARLWAGCAVGPAITPVLAEPDLDAQVDRLLDELPARFVLAGLSLGAIVAMALVRRAPERVSQLCLMSTNPYAPTNQQRIAWQRQRDALASGASARNIQRDLLPVLLSAPVLTRCPEVVEQTLAMADDVGEEVLDCQLRLQATRIDERPGLAAVGCPTLVVAARDDALCPVDRHTEIAAIVPGAELVVLERCAHLSPLEQPGRLSEALARWLCR
jgi:pimeloyl-ACP methyl ester carboxylesterase